MQNNSELSPKSNMNVQHFLALLSVTVTKWSLPSEVVLSLLAAPLIQIPTLFKCPQDCTKATFKMSTLPIPFHKSCYILYFHIILKLACNHKIGQATGIFLTHTLNIFLGNVHFYSKFKIQVDLTEGINIHNPDTLFLSQFARNISSICNTYFPKRQERALGTEGQNWKRSHEGF